MFQSIDVSNTLIKSNLSSFLHRAYITQLFSRPPLWSSMFLGTLLLLTILTSAQVWGRTWPPGEEAGQDDGKMMRNFGGLQEAWIQNENTNSTIIKDAILRTLRSPPERTNQKMDKRDSNEETATLDATVCLRFILRVLEMATKVNSPTRNRDRTGRIRIL